MYKQVSARTYMSELRGDNSGRRLSNQSRGRVCGQNRYDRRVKTNVLDLSQCLR